MGIYDDREDDNTSIMGRLSIEQRGGNVRDLSTGGCVVERPNYGGMTDYSRHDALGNKTDSHQGFSTPW